MFKLIADSTCDLSDEILARYKIDIAPLSIVAGGKSYQDRVDISPDEFYAMMVGFTTPATTAMPSPEAFLKLMEAAVAEGYKEILCITMSSGTSGSYQSAIIAKDLFDDLNTGVRLHVVDSLSMSHGSGYLILKSARLREQGMSFDEVVAFNESFKKHVKHFLSVDDLDNLIRSGRLTNASAMIGKLLKIKPIMSMRDGKGAIVAKERGRKRVMQHIVEAFKMRNDPEMSDFIIIGYTSDKAYAENLKQLMQTDAQYQGEIFMMQMGVAVGTHVGLGGLSMFFIEKYRHKDGLLANELEGLKRAQAEIKKKIADFASQNMNKNG